MRILVTGAHGQLGHELKRCLDSGFAEIGPIPAAYANAVVDYTGHDDFDIGNEAAISEWMLSRGPYDLVINCAAATNVDGCELDEASALKANALGPYYLAAACNKQKAKLMHVSTDYVFSGKDSRPRREEDKPCPLSAYGRTKYAGELLVSDACQTSFIVRTSWLYGYAGRSFPKTIIRLAREHGKISVVADQCGCPTLANDLAYELLRIGATNKYGLYHCSGIGVCSWYEFACAIIDSFNLECEKEPLSTEEYRERFPGSARRPSYSALENTRLGSTIGDEMRPWREALASFAANLNYTGI